MINKRAQTELLRRNNKYIFCFSFWLWNVNIWHYIVITQNVWKVCNYIHKYVVSTWSSDRCESRENQISLVNTNPVRRYLVLTTLTTITLLKCQSKDLRGRSSKMRHVCRSGLPDTFSSDLHVVLHSPRSPIMWWRRCLSNDLLL